MAHANKIIITSAMLILAIALVGCTQPANQDNNSGSGTLTNNNVNNINLNIGTDRNANIYNNLDQFKVVKTGDKVSVDYTGKLTDGNIFDSSKNPGRTPLEFTVGAGQMIAGFDAAVIGMKVGETKTVTLPPTQAYGEVNPALIKTFDANKIPDFNKIKVGDKLATNTGQRVTVIAKTDANATIDLNPELAGKTLIFEITLVSIN